MFLALRQLSLEEANMVDYPRTFELATTDTLTGLLAAPYFRHLLHEELLPTAKQDGGPLAIFHFDIDDFHGVNTNYGHDCGDEVLRAITAALREAMPEGALLSRYSGDEFAGALPDTRLDDSFTLAEEFRRRVVALRFERWPEVRVACSIGLAAYPGNGSDDVELVRAADQALFVAKSTGRNKVSLPLADSRMITKTSHYTATQLERLAQMAKTVGRNEATLLREALDDLLKKYNDKLGAADVVPVAS
jgi:diguanylate cyclase (GGDEF)-like protein